MNFNIPWMVFNIRRFLMAKKPKIGTVRIYIITKYKILKNFNQPN